MNISQHFLVSPVKYERNKTQHLPGHSTFVILKWNAKKCMLLMYKVKNILHRLALSRPLLASVGNRKASEATTASDEVARGRLRT